METVIDRKQRKKFYLGSVIQYVQECEHVGSLIWLYETIGYLEDDNTMYDFLSKERYPIFEKFTGGKIPEIYKQEKSFFSVKPYFEGRRNWLTNDEKLLLDIDLLAYAEEKETIDNEEVLIRKRELK